MTSSNIAVVRDYLSAIEAFDAEATGLLLDTEMVQTEYPNQLTPKVRRRGREALLADLEHGRQVLTRQSYRIEEICAEGDTVFAEARWEGILAVPIGKLGPGDAMVAHTCLAFRLRGGRIVAQRNYDCFEAFGAA